MGSLPWVELMFGLGVIAFGWHQTRLMRKDRERREAEAKTVGTGPETKED
ncbi:MAG: hypothetical protein AAGF44_00080 [Pseudomonadota bacterium]